VVLTVKSPERPSWRAAGEFDGAELQARSAAEFDFGVRRDTEAFCVGKEHPLCDAVIA